MVLLMVLLALALIGLAVHQTTDVRLLYDKLTCSPVIQERPQKLAEIPLGREDCSGQPDKSLALPKLYVARSEVTHLLAQFGCPLNVSDVVVSSIESNITGTLVARPAEADYVVRLPTVLDGRTRWRAGQL